VLAARPWRERSPMRLMAWAVLGAIVLHSLLEYPLWYGPFQLAFGLCLGLLWPGRDRAMRPLAASLAALALMAAVGYAAWDYTRISQIFLVRAQRMPSLRDDTIAKLQSSWLFANQVRFAELTLTPVTRDNAQAMHDLAQRVLHFSPEPRSITLEAYPFLEGEELVEGERLRAAREAAGDDGDAASHRGSASSAASTSAATRSGQPSRKRRKGADDRQTSAAARCQSSPAGVAP